MKQTSSINLIIFSMIKRSLVEHLSTQQKTLTNFSFQNQSKNLIYLHSNQIHHIFIIKLHKANQNFTERFCINKKNSHLYKQRIIKTKTKSSITKQLMTTIRNFPSFEENKPGARYTIVRDLERKDRELSKYLNTCQLYKKVNPEQKPKRSELIEEMYQNKKVMRNRTCRRNGAQKFNFKKESASRVIAHSKAFHKESKFGFNGKTLNKREIKDTYLEEIYEE